MKLRTLSFITAASFALALAVTGQAYALKAGPTLIELKAAPGESVSASMLLENDTQDKLTLTPSFLDAEPTSDESGYATYTQSNEFSTLSKWISTKDREVVLMPGEKVNVAFYVTVPTEASIGGHYAAVGWRQVAQAPKLTGASITGFPAINIALDVAGITEEKGDILSFSTSDGKTNYDKLPVSFVTRINNGGNRHFNPKGSIQIKNMFGSVVAELAFNETKGGGNVLPRSTREFKNEWLGEFAFGKYTAELTAQLGGAGTKTASLELWVMPAGLLVLWLIIALIIIVILVLLIKRALQSSAAVKK